MNQNEDPYDVLGVPRDASPEEIKSVYRKAALQTHPDKCSDESQRAAATEQFARLSNAYEVLSDPIRKQQYDATMDDRRTGRFYYPNIRFHDPFQIFEHVFRDEFGGSQQQQQQQRQQQRSGGFFDRDPFFSGHPFFGGGNNRQDPFFGGSASRDPFEAFFGPGGVLGGGRFPPMDEMRRMQEQMNRPDRGNNNNKHFFSSSSTRSSTTYGGNGEAITTVTTTRRVNGKEQTVTEKIIQKPDGTVDRQVETSGDPDLALPAADTNANQGSTLHKLARRFSTRRALPSAPPPVDPFRRQFGMTPEQREQLQDDDDDNDDNEPTPAPKDDTNKPKSRWFWW